MGAAENKQFISNMFAELSKGNGDAFLNALADDVSFTIIGSTKYSGTFKGKQELINKLLAPLNAQIEGGMTITPDNLIANGKVQQVTEYLDTELITSAFGKYNDAETCRSRNDGISRRAWPSGPNCDG